MQSIFWMNSFKKGRFSMSAKLSKYLDVIFSPYEELPQIKELKEELSHDLQEKINDLKKEGHNEDEAFKRATESIGNIEELIEEINDKTRELQQLIGMDFSLSKLEDSDFASTDLSSGKFNYSDLKGSDFQYANLTQCVFKASNLENSNFSYANLTDCKITACNLKKASFDHCILKRTDFGKSSLAGVSFEAMTLDNVNFTYAGLKKTSFRNAILKNVCFKTKAGEAIFDGATMDKGTYALLKGYRADLKNVTIL